MASEVLDVAQAAVYPRPVGLAHSNEVRAQPADGVLGNVCQRLASSCPKNEGPNAFVNSGYVVISDKRIWVQIIIKDWESLSYDYLKKK